MIKKSANDVLILYKGKILLFNQHDYIINFEENPWSLLDIVTLKKLKIKDAVIVPLTSSLSYIKLTDENVNSLRRDNGCRLEFYRFEEIEKLLLTSKTRNLLTSSQEDIKTLL